MKIAQILNGKAHWIFEADELPDYPPTSDGQTLVFVDITDKPEVQEGWGYDSETGEFSEPIIPAPEPIPYQPTEYETLSAKVDYLTMLIEPAGV